LAFIWPFFNFQELAFLKLLMAKFGLFNFFGPDHPVPCSLGFFNSNGAGTHSDLVTFSIDFVILKIRIPTHVKIEVLLIVKCFF